MLILFVLLETGLNAGSVLSDYDSSLAHVYILKNSPEVSLIYNKTK